MEGIIQVIKNKINTSELKKYEEEIKVVDFTFRIRNSLYVTKEIIQEIVSVLPIRDNFEIIIVNDAEDGIQIIRNIDLDGLNWEICNGDEIEMICHIDKTTSDNNEISVYYFDKFCEKLLEKSTLKVMEIFSKLLDERDYLIFEVLDQVVNYMTKSIYFTSKITEDIVVTNNRKEELEMVKSDSNFRNFYLYKLLPGDFAFSISASNNKLNKCFNKIETILSICYIANDSEIVNYEIIEAKIFGQRNICMEIKIDDVIRNKELIKIYNWIYEGGNTTDKSIIARNILSLHCKYANILNTDEKTFSSIQSNFNLYQKSNVDRYLNLKKDVGKNVTTIIEKTNELAFSIPNGIKNNILAAFSFLFTVILANIVSEAPLTNIFTRDITVIFEMILLFSFVFLLYSVYETNYKIKQMQKGFEKFKKIYVDVFDDEELSELIGEDDFKNNVLKKIKLQKNIAVIIWMVLLIISFIIVESVSSAPTIDIINEWLKNIKK